MLCTRNKKNGRARRPPYVWPAEVDRGLRAIPVGGDRRETFTDKTLSGLFQLSDPLTCCLLARCVGAPAM